MTLSLILLHSNDEYVCVSVSMSVCACRSPHLDSFVHSLYFLLRSTYVSLSHHIRERERETRTSGLRCIQLSAPHDFLFFTEGRVRYVGVGLHVLARFVVLFAAGVYYFHAVSAPHARTFQFENSVHSRRRARNGRSASTMC